MFPLTLGQRFAALFPNARLVEIADSYTFVPQDQPEQLVQLIISFVGAHAAA